MNLAYGDIVEPISPAHQLHSGCNWYDSAVVMSVEPFVLVSKETDMRWSCTVSAENFRKIGTASEEQMKLCQRRALS